VLLLVFQWIRATLPRLRADQLMRFAWLYLIPLTLANIIITGGLLLLPLDRPVRLGISAAANWLLLILVLVTFRRVTGLSAASTIPRWLRRQVAATAAAKAAATRAAQSPEPASAGRR
jgi:NADH-quinone oxidoreductase subunit H